MKLEYGKKYKTRGGQIVGPLVEVPHTWGVDDGYKFGDTETGMSWSCNGGYWDFGKDSDRDIVEEVTEESQATNPYTRTLPTYPDGTSDIYCVLKGYKVTCPAIAHAVKKLLAPGCRSGGKSYTQDLEEARDSIQKALDLEGSK
jgi:hypothetical protein